MHPREVALLWIVSTHLVLLPWALGGMPGWAQLASLAFALAGFGVAVSPRIYDEAPDGGKGFSLHPWRKLVRFPVFWSGMLLVLYVLIQALNPAWQYWTNGKLWRILPLEHVPWLPHSVKTPFGLGGPWRALLVYASAWLVLCSIWVGFTRRRAIQILITTVAINGAAIAIFGIVERFTTTKMFWFWEPPAPYFFGSFVYKNHAGAFLVMITALCAALATWYHLRGVRRGEKSNPSGVFAFFCLLLGVAIVLTNARGAALLAPALLLLTGAVLLAHRPSGESTRRRTVIGVLVALLFGGFLFVGGRSLQHNRTWSELGQLFGGKDASVSQRQAATKATWAMIETRPWLGVGAGGFRFFFPRFQRAHPVIMKEDGRRLYWEHAHNDFVQIPAELGIIGTSFLLFSGVCGAVKLVRVRVWRTPLPFIIAAGLLSVLVYAWSDFHFYNPAIVLTWCALWPALLSWSALEARPGRE